jgi:predicted transposase YbfD/YdcC
LKDKQGEATAAANFMKMFGRQLPPGVVTFDAGLTGPSMCKATISAGHQYIAAVKGNAGHAYDEIVGADWDRSGYTAKTTDKKHGRIEKREIQILNLSFLKSQELRKYVEIKRVARVKNTVIQKGAESVEYRYFIISHLEGQSPSDILSIIRKHWSIENHLHWTKDVVLREDELPKQSHRASKTRGFLNAVAISIACSMSDSVKRFTESFRYNCCQVLLDWLSL